MAVIWEVALVLFWYFTNLFGHCIMQTFLFFYRFLYDSIKIIRHMAANTDKELFNHAMLTLDEIDVKRTIELDKKNQKIVGPFKKMQTVMIRGLASP